MGSILVRAALGLAVMVDLAHAGAQIHLKSGSLELRDEGQRIQALSARGNPSQIGHGQIYIIQYDRPLTESDRAALESRGVEVLQYLPDYAWVVRGQAQGLMQMRQFGLGSFEKISRVRPEWKVDPALGDLVARGTQETLDLWVTAWDASAGQELLRLVRGTEGVRVLSEGQRDIAVRAPLRLVQEWSNVDSVEWIQELPIVVPLMFQPLEDTAESNTPPVKPALTGFESGTRLMGFEKAWERGYSGEGQSVAVADTGLDTGDRATLHGDFTENFAQGYIMGAGGESWADPQGHGTHVMGSVLGSGALSDGAFRGGAYSSQLHAAGMWSAIFNNIMPPSDYNRLMGEPLSAGARIHSNSWGSPRNLGDYDMNAARVDEFMWKNPDMLVLFAAGNSGVDGNMDGRIDEGSVSSPGTAKNVLTVGASENLLAEGGIQRPHGQLRDGDKKWGVEPLKSDTLSNNPSGLAAFSSRGPTRDGRLKPEIVAPGTNIVSARSHHPQATTLWGAYDENYSYAGGTSMATPLTAGAAAVAREYLVKARAVSSPSAALVKGALIHTAFDLFPGQYGVGAQQELPTQRPNVHEGYGRVNMDQLTVLGGETILVDERVGLATGESKSWTVTAPAGATVRATLVWTDAPGSPSAGKMLVNNLDLEVQSARSGLLATLADSVNNHEMVELKRVASGRYKVSVRGTNVPSGRAGKQPFALLVSVEKSQR
jgi:serine protease AprX